MKDFLKMKRNGLVEVQNYIIKKEDIIGFSCICYSEGFNRATSSYASSYEPVQTDKFELIVKVRDISDIKVMFEKEIVGENISRRTHFQDGCPEWRVQHSDIFNDLVKETKVFLTKILIDNQRYEKTKSSKN